MTPTRPSSSPIAAMMKSVLANGTVPGRPSPSPVPVSPPVPKPNSDWTSWKPFLSGSANGSSQVSTRRCTCANRKYAVNAPPTNSSTPMTSQLVRSVAM